ncbi:MAG: hypothetical protein HFJ05_01805 [Eubacterium sp.]|nr:hypothetical protein [Eubacterium sp.]
MNVMKLKKLLTGLLCFVLVLANAAPAAACTGIYIGDGVSENGSSYMGRCEDVGYNYVKIFGVSEARDYPDDYVYTDSYGFSMPYGGHVYRYTYIKDSALQGETMDDFEAYAEAGQNEKGVSVSATVSTYGGQAPEKADPLDDSTGICEISITTILLGKAATAKEAVDLLANIVDTYGAGECNQITISDPDETWYFEIVSGHQYAAIKLPPDKVLINPNIMMLGVIDVTDTENVVASENLVSLAQENGFLVTDESGKIDVAKTYSNKNSGSGQYVRYMQGLFYINRAEAETIKVDFGAVDNNSKTDALVTLLHDPDRKMSTLDIMHLLSTRGEGTPYDQNAGTAKYSIGNNRQAECHIFETRSSMPIGLATIQWQNVCPSEFSIYIPYYSAAVTGVLEQYQEESLTYVDNSMFWTFASIYRMCNANRTKAGTAVRAYFEKYQKSLIKQQKAVDAVMEQVNSRYPKRFSEAATELGIKLAEQVYQTALQVKAELEAYTAGDMSEPLTLSSDITDVMPEYEILANKLENTYRMEELKTLIQELKQTVTGLGTAADAQELLIQELGTKLTQAGVKLDELETALEDLQKTEAGQGQAIEDVKDQLAQADKKLTESESKIDELSDAVARLEAAINSQNASTAAKDKTIQGLSGQLQQALAANRELETTVQAQKTAAGVKDTKIIKLAVKTAKASIRLSWKKAGSYDVDSYRIYRSTSKNGSYKQVKKVKGTAASVKLSTKKLKSGKTYYYRIRGVKKVNGTDIFTKYSAKISNKVK